MLKKTLQCLEGIHLSQSGSLLMLYVDKLLSTPFRVLARMVDTLACRRVEMLLAETLQVQLLSWLCKSCQHIKGLSSIAKNVQYLKKITWKFLILSSVIHCHVWDL